jgi:hypothetical protein
MNTAGRNKRSGEQNKRQVRRQAQKNKTLPYTHDELLQFLHRHPNFDREILLQEHFQRKMHEII